MMSSTLQIDGGGEGLAFDAYAALPQQPNGRAVVILHEIFGVNSAVRDLAQRFAADGYVAIAPDLYWRTEPGLALGYTREETLRAMEIVKRFDHALALEDVGRVVDEARSWPDVRSGVAVVGLCLGGTLSFLAAADLDIDAAVAFYGTALERHLDIVPRMRCPLMLQYGGKDRFIPADAVAQIAGALKGRSNAYVHTYPDADHGFYTRGRAQDIALAHQRTLAFLDVAFAARELRSATQRS